MFVETITQPRDEWDRWNAKLRIHTDPPSALAASIAWESGNGMVTVINVWDAPDAISDFYMDRVLPLVEADGEPEHKPERHGEPVSIYLRP